MRRTSGELHPAKAIAQRMQALEADLQRARNHLHRERGRGTSDRWGLQQPAQATPEEGWFLTYLDVMTLLLVALIVMLAFSGTIGSGAAHQTPPGMVLVPAIIPSPDGDQPYPAITTPIFMPRPASTSVFVPPPVVLPAPHESAWDVGLIDSAEAEMMPALATAPPTESEHLTESARESEPVDLVSEGQSLASTLPLDELGSDVEIIVNQRSVSFRINSEILFSIGQADLSPSGLSVLQRTAHVLSKAGYDITVEGHTDAIPVRGTARYPSNWELSSARAGSVVRYLEANGIDKTHLKAVGYADTRPIADNSNGDGRARNRRVELMIEKSAPSAQDDAQP